VNHSVTILSFGSPAPECTTDLLCDFEGARLELGRVQESSAQNPRTGDGSFELFPWSPAAEDGTGRTATALAS